MTDAQRRIVSDTRATQARREAEGFGPARVSIEAAPRYAPSGSILMRVGKVGHGFVIEPSGRRWRLDA